MPISTNTLFHFTATIDGIVSILSDEFRPRISLEDFSVLAKSEPQAPSSFAYPMVCFCDIPLSQTHRHMEAYGRYALGLTKEWATRNSVTPVLYIHRDGVATTCIRELRRATNALRANGTPAQHDELAEHLTKLTLLMKPYEGPFVRPTRTVEKVRFYDEREWRWLPPDAHRTKVLTREEYFDFDKLKAANDAAWDSARLSFEPSDIRYVIVAAEPERLPMIRALERIKGAKYNEEVIRVITSRIITADQIRDDF